MIVLGYDKDSEMFNIKKSDKFYLRSDGGTFCNGIYYLPDEDEIPPNCTVKLLNRIYNCLDDGKNMIDNFLEELKAEAEEEE